MFLIENLDKEDEQEKNIIQAHNNDYINVDIFPSNFYICVYTYIYTHIF